MSGYTIISLLTCYILDSKKESCTLEFHTLPLELCHFRVTSKFTICLNCSSNSEPVFHIINSVESFLESRKLDPEKILLNLGFGGSQDSNGDLGLSRIPQRFLQPSKVYISLCDVILTVFFMNACVNSKKRTQLIKKKVLFTFFFLF
jgi:hypothetical protein